MLSELINQPCTLLLREETGAKDDYGNARTADESVETVCELQQINRAEEADQGETSDTTWRAIFGPDDADILDTASAIVVEGARYELVGAPWQARNPRTRELSHIEATVRRTAGAENAS